MLYVSLFDTILLLLINHISLLFNLGRLIWRSIPSFLVLHFSFHDVCRSLTSLFNAHCYFWHFLSIWTLRFCFPHVARLSFDALYQFWRSMSYSLTLLFSFLMLYITFDVVCLSLWLDMSLIDGPYLFDVARLFWCCMSLFNKACLSLMLHVCLCWRSISGSLTLHFSFLDAVCYFLVSLSLSFPLSLWFCTSLFETRCLFCRWSLSIPFHVF